MKLIMEGSFPVLFLPFCPALCPSTLLLIGTFACAAAFKWYLVDMELRLYLARLRSIMLFLVTFTYYGPLHHYTIDPIEALARHQADIKHVRDLLRYFKSQKREELALVKKAVSFGNSHSKLSLILG